MCLQNIEVKVPKEKFKDIKAALNRMQKRADRDKQQMIQER